MAMLSRYVIPVVLALLAAIAPGCGPQQASAAQSDGVYKAVLFSSSAPDAALAQGGAVDGPETILMDRLQGRFDAARFTHKAHADMARMGGGCATCHHNPPPEKTTLGCVRCHTGPLDEKTAGSLGLKGAIHEQCMGCHAECGVGGDCLLCHARKGEQARTGTASWPRAAQPGKKVYETPREGGDRVSFDHKNHAKECGPCSSCHKNESCAVCHAPAGARAPRPKAADHHAKCMDCHGKGKDLEFECKDCHAR